MASDLLLILICVILQSIGQLSLKHGMGAAGPISSASSPIRKVIFSFLNPFVLVGFLLFFGASILWLVVLSRVDVSWAFPMVSLSYVLVVISSRFLLKEDAGPARLVGTLVICIGVFFVSLSG